MKGTGLEIQKNISLHQYTTFHIGGVADYFAVVRDSTQLCKALQFAKERTDRPPFILGGGSNVLASDEGYRGMVILIAIKGREYTELEDGALTMLCGAGEILDDVIAEVSHKNIWGLENLSSIPGTVGATPVQNVGAYGVEVSSLILSVTAMHIKTKKEKIFLHEECLFSYRNSFFKTEEGKLWVITHVTFALTRNHHPQLQYADLKKVHNADTCTPSEIRNIIAAIRAEKFPDWSKVGTAGSFFKNPLITKEHFESLVALYPGIVGYIQEDGLVKVSLGWILDKVCDLKGFTSGNVSLYEKQALVLVVNKNATAEEVKKISKEIEKKVFLKTEIKIEREVLFL